MAKTESEAVNQDKVLHWKQCGTYHVLQNTMSKKVKWLRSVLL